MLSKQEIKANEESVLINVDSKDNGEEKVEMEVKKICVCIY